MDPRITPPRPTSIAAFIQVQNPDGSGEYFSLAAIESILIADDDGPVTIALHSGRKIRVIDKKDDILNLVTSLQAAYVMRAGSEAES